MHNRIIMDINNFNIINNKLLLFVYNCFTYEYYYDNKIFDSSLLKDKLLVFIYNCLNKNYEIIISNNSLLMDLKYLFIMFYNNRLKNKKINIISEYIIKKSVFNVIKIFSYAKKYKPYSKGYLSVLESFNNCLKIL